MRIIKEHHLSPSDVIVVGDSIKDDIGGAIKAGLRSVHIAGQFEGSWSYENEQNTPTWTIKHIGELPALLKEEFKL